MLKSCKYCNRIHDTKHNCGRKPKPNYAKYKNYANANDKDRFRWSTSWVQKRNEIRDRDLNLCQICIRKLYNTINQYNYEYLSVHHVVSLEDDYSKRLDNSNLITVCDYHHKCAERKEIPLKELLEIIKEQESKII